MARLQGDTFCKGLKESDMVNYGCEVCGKKTSAAASADIPECCGKKMKQTPLDVCTAPHDAETYRAQNADDACDDGIR